MQLQERKGWLVRASTRERSRSERKKYPFPSRRRQDIHWAWSGLTEAAGQKLGNFDCLAASHRGSRLVARFNRQLSSEATSDSMKAFGPRGSKFPDKELGWTQTIILCNTDAFSRSPSICSAFFSTDLCTSMCGSVRTSGNSDDRVCEEPFISKQATK